MFTIPVGNFVNDSVYKRPTANAPTFRVTNPANAYDTSSDTYAYFDAPQAPEGGTGYTTAECIYSLFPSFTILVARLNVLLSGTGVGNTIYVSIDGGTNYFYNMPISVKPTVNISSLQTSSIAIPVGATSTSIKVKITSTGDTSAGSTLKVYDIYIQQ